MDTESEEMLSPLAPGRTSARLGTVSRVGTKCGDERSHPREVHAQTTHARHRAGGVAGSPEPTPRPGAGLVCLLGLWLYS